MKPMSALKNKLLACSLAAVLLGSAAPVLAANVEPVIQGAGNVTYVSGGVGDDYLLGGLGNDVIDGGSISMTGVRIG